MATTFGTPLLRLLFGLAVVPPLAAGGVLARDNGFTRLPLAQTLRSILAESEIDTTRGPKELDRPIVDYATHDSGDLFVVAYYWLSPGLESPADALHVSVLDKHTRSWRHTALRRQQETAPGEPWILGSILSIASGSGFLFLESHVNPSASLLLVLRREDLGLAAVLPGWIKTRLPDGRVVFEHNTIHFAPTHSAALWIFDPASVGTRALYPTGPAQPVRRAYVEQVRRLYEQLGPAWMQAHNHHGDPEQFDSSIMDPIVIGSHGHSIAFITRFGSDDRVEGSTPALDVLVVCSLSRDAAPCTEASLADVQRAHPGWSTQAILDHTAGR